jgi:hypothetical protein
VIMNKCKILTYVVIPITESDMAQGGEHTVWKRFLGDIVINIQCFHLLAFKFCSTAAALVLA